MPESLIQSPLWSEYDAYKISKKEDPEMFLPGNDFETNFLVRMIMEHYPQYTEMTIRLSIGNIQRILYGSCKRGIFIKLVIANLLQRKPLVIS